MTKIEEDDRREFLKASGRFAVVTPPAISILLSTSLTSDAIAVSGVVRRGDNQNQNDQGQNNNAQ
ncbi:hypothetical protein JQ596_38555 [Bradyrhizobium manausense]|uniref:hypothetical protein n=1 Tax=Bradyrhizobium manausense TaxID=989370 RepID=UPI001BA74FCE|nr:hypothetical protein [Bradyrhizobium manausense]MBR0831423.1 hypothetical protein [Bradyrhizobium manausense]